MILNFIGTISSPRDGRRCSQRPPPSLRPDQSSRPKFPSLSRRIVATVQSGPLKIVPTSRSVSPVHGPVSACACPAVGAAFAAAPVTS